MGQRIPAQGGQEAQQPGQEGGGIADLFRSTGESLVTINQAVSQAQVPDQARELFAGALQMFQQGVEAMSGGGQQRADAGSGPEQVGGAQGAQQQNPAF